MVNGLELKELPQADEVYMIAGWRQWADAGSVSSSLPDYLIKKTGARMIGEMSPDGYYLFQIPGTHDLVRPTIKYDQGFPESLRAQENRFFYTENSRRGIVIFLGDEPHIDGERYVRTVLEAARSLHVKRIVGLGGVYGELPYDKERMITASFSLPKMRPEMDGLAVTLTDYQGGASIGSYLCKRAGEIDLEYLGLYAFVPMYDLSGSTPGNASVRVENDYAAWLGIMRRINYMFKTNFDLDELTLHSRRLLRTLETRIDELEKQMPEVGVRDYFRKLSEDFNEMPFIPLDDVWEENLRKILDKFDEDDQAKD
jgi:predicted ATP-grasp superfamily ATP-dependent carboligase